MEDYKYKLSIIIPMYNAEKYIGICLDSILGSNLLKEEYEIVIVNDGSQDKSSEIAKGYSSKFSNVTYLTQENQGQSTARNYGIKTCKGEYVWCVDADDTVSSQLKFVLDILSQYPKLDILSTWLKVVTEDNVLVRSGGADNIYNKLISGREAVISGYAPGSVCGLLIRKDFLLSNELFFYPNLTHQDVELSFRAFAYAKKVYFLDETIYNYVLHSNSVTQSLTKRKKYIIDNIKIYESFVSLYLNFEKTDIELSNAIRKYNQKALFGLVFSLWKNRNEWKELGINKEVLSILEDKGLYPLRGNFYSMKKNLFVFFLNIKSLLVN